ncbi:hypothetical protein F0562_019920 [Nyssa sinensis]|uniref:Bidirectional sugar transporter SWEET n=1 Tax=Nyssa sinensis TaxID=561372 RepID=A0A5J5BV89_9ASTE|nr:hypothetical protein F0562_019920 [Nyssa sinensis]
MATPDFIVGIIGNIISILLCASPVGMFWQVVKKKSAENYNGLPYISALLCKSLWAFYGVLDPDGLLIVTVNCIGVAAQFTYVTLYLIYTPTDKKVKLVSLVAILNIGLPASVIMVTLLAFHGCVRQIFVGVLCAAVTVAMYAAPLLVMVPNAVGLVLGSTQLIFYLVYNSKSSSMLSLVTVEEGSSHLVKEGIKVQDSIEDNEETIAKTKSLDDKGTSLPKPSMSRTTKH